MELLLLHMTVEMHKVTVMHGDAELFRNDDIYTCNAHDFWFYNCMMVEMSKFNRCKHP